MKNSGMFFGKIFLTLGILCWSIAQTQAAYENYTFTHFAGPSEVPSWHDGTGSDARFSGPYKIAFDHNGNAFVADYGNHTIRKITAAGAVTTVAGLAGNAGSVDGTGSNARFNNPAAIAIDNAGNLFVADYGNNTIRKVTPAGVVTTFAGKSGIAGSADGKLISATFNHPIGLTFDNAGNLFVADGYNDTIRKIGTDGKVTTFAGKAGSEGSVDGTGTAARFQFPFGITADTSGNIYVVNYGGSFNTITNNMFVTLNTNCTIRKISSAGVVTTLAGTSGISGTNNGTGSAASFNQPFDIAFSGGNLFVADTYNHEIRQVTLNGEVTTLAGTPGVSGSNDGTKETAQFYYPTGVGADSNGNILVADYANNSIRKIAGNNVTTLAGISGVGSRDGNVDVAQFNFPAGVAVDQNGNTFVADLANHTIRKIAVNGDVTTLAGLAGKSGSTNGTGSDARFFNPLGVAVDDSGNVFVTDYGNSTIRKITSSGEVTTLAGSPGQVGKTNGTGSDARFSSPFFLTIGNGGNLFVSDTANHMIRQVTLDGVVTTFAGKAGTSGTNDATGTNATFYFPEGIVSDSSGNLFVADNGNHTIRKITTAGEVTTFAGSPGNSGDADGTGSAARFLNPFGLAIDGSDNIYVADYGNDLIRKITPAGVVTTLGGLAKTAGGENGTGSNARFSGPEGLAADVAGNLFIADSSNHDIRKGAPAAPDVPVVDVPIGQLGTSRQLSISNLTTTSWSWKIIRKPANSTAELSATNISNPTLTPDVSDLFILRFEGKDDSGKIAIGTVSIEARSPDVLTLTTSGQGSVTPNYGNSKLTIGNSYTLTAKPVKGYIFAGWTGGIESNNPKLTFTMTSNLVLQASFIPDPFPPVAGNYQGLFFESSGVKLQSSGYFNGKVTTKGKLSAKISMGGKSYSVSGQLSATGEFQTTVARAGMSSLTVQLQVDMNGNEVLTGQITNSVWTADLTADRNVFTKLNPSPVVRYTVGITSSADSTQSPGGYGFGTLTGDAKGNLKFSGTLGDGTKISQKSFHTKDARWPFYASLYSGNGEIMSWLQFTGTSVTNLEGPVAWIKVAQPGSKTYPAGFTNEVNVLGSTYIPTNGAPLLNFTNGEINFGGGNLSADFSNNFSIAAGDKVSNLSANNMTLKFTRNTGLFKGSVTDPATTTSIPFSGVLIQNQNKGYGFFINGTQTGSVLLHVKPN